MNSIEITKNLNNELVNYLTTIFDVNKDNEENKLAQKIRESYEISGALFKGPFLELILPYKRGVSLNQLIKEKVLSPKLSQLQSFKLENPEPIPLDAFLYRHQEIAIRKLSSEKKSIVISSGTGSGKTEGFLIPIINDLLEDETPGVRAVLIYPLNALVNDQLDRLRTLLKGTNITFGRYTGELPENKDRTQEDLPNEIICRKEIREQNRIPQILITNYAMLEYLLLRPEDKVIFESGKWRFLVLDEAHTYIGAQGIEVSMLIRRLKQRLEKLSAEIQCIATSATLVNDADNAVDFAQKLFDIQITKEDIIFGEIDKQAIELNNEIENSLKNEIYINENFPNLLLELRKEDKDYSTIVSILNKIGLLNSEAFENIPSSEDGIQEFLFKELSKNAELIRLKNWMIEKKAPVEVTEASNFLFPNLEEQKRNDALYHLIELGANIRPGTNKLPLLPAKYHLFVRPPQGIWVCINPNCPGKEKSSTTNWSYLYSTPHLNCDFCGAMVYPIGLCRQCGQTYLLMQKNEEVYEPASDQIVENVEKRFFTWKKIKENKLLGIDDNQNDENESEDEVSKDLVQTDKEIFICLSCGKEKELCNCENQVISIPLYEIDTCKNKKQNGKEKKQISPAKEISQCPRCLTKSKKGTEIVTPMTTSGETILSNLAYELYRQLPPSNKKDVSIKPGNGRKLLTFYDSRQGAARFAAFLQDVCNKQNYRHIIPEAIESLVKEKGYYPSLDGLSNKCCELAWKYQIVQNDPDSDSCKKFLKKPSHEEREKQNNLIKAQILGEFTTGSRNRQSLEQMGLVGIEYFEEDSLPDFELLAKIIKLKSDQTRTLISLLLDDLRFQKVIKLPDGIYSYDPNFGENLGNPSLIKQGRTNPSEIRWIGVNPKQHRRKYIQNILKENLLDSSDENITKVLGIIWDWIIDETDIFSNSTENGYQLNPNRFFFRTDLNWYRCKKCTRLSYRDNTLPCSFQNCNGTLEKIDINQTQSNNYFYRLFKKDIIPVRIEEHTAQLDAKKGMEYQKDFKNGEINILSCSTTFEMGIDLGDLQTVLLSNVPPTVANYRQRSGRAGRRTNDTAFILTWASNRPHDQSYYQNPAEIISGEIVVPNLTIENEIILQRHTNAILLSLFLRYLQRNSYTNLSQCRYFFDPPDTIENPYFDQLDTWREVDKNIIEENLKVFSKSVKWNYDKIINNSVNDFINSIVNLKNNNYLNIINNYNENIRLLGEESSNPKLKTEEIFRISNRRNHYIKLRERMHNELLINYLSNKAIIPSYSFPLHTVELLLPLTEQKNEHLRLQRDIRQAIREYAPGSEIVADKRIWKSAQPFFVKDVVTERQYYICKKCHNLLISKATGIPVETYNGFCPVCGEQIRKVKNFVEPDGFVADPKSGKPAKQYINVEPSLMRSALLPMATKEEEQLGELISLAYERNGQLLYVNEGTLGKGFKFSLEKYNFLLDDVNEKEGNFSLGHIQETDTLHIRFIPNEIISIPDSLDESFWLSLMYSIIQASSHYLQIERKDIDGVLSPRKNGKTWEQTIVLYDNVPGGAGHVKNIKFHLIEILHEAERILNCNDCGLETSCYHCLRDYNNQIFHSLLKRKSALHFIEQLIGNLLPIKSNIPDAIKVESSNVSIWLIRLFENTHTSLSLALNEINAGHPLGANYSWLDNINDLLNKQCKVNLYLQEIPKQNSSDVINFTKLYNLMEKGLNLYQIKELPKVQIIKDEGIFGEERAVWAGNEQTIKLSKNLGCNTLLSTISFEGISEAKKEFDKLIAKRIFLEQLG